MTSIAGVEMEPHPGDVHRSDWDDGHEAREEEDIILEECSLTPEPYSHLSNNRPDSNHSETRMLHFEYQSGGREEESSDLRCSTCSKKFNTLSEYNKHENQHSKPKPHECLVQGCNAVFSQKQHLDRHNQSRHEKFAKYYHCTTEGCKYSCTDKRAKKFLREDHMKAHIKLYGHYGPQSPGERERRPKQGISGITVRIVFEEWELYNECAKRRKLRIAKLESWKSPLWYADVVDKRYVLEKDCDSGSGFHCDQPVCYFAAFVSEELQPLAFRMESDLIIHKRRTFHRSYQEIAGTQEKCQYRDENQSDLDSEDKTTSRVASDIDTRPHCLSQKENEGFSDYWASSSNAVNPLIGSASFCGIGPHLGDLSGSSELLPWSLGSGCISQDNESLRTQTQKMYEPDSDMMQPSTVPEVDTLATVAWAGSWNSHDNESAIDESFWLDRQFTVGSSSDSSCFSTASSSVLGDEGSFSETPEFLIPTPTSSSTFGFPDLRSDSFDFVTPDLPGFYLPDTGSEAVETAVQHNAELESMDDLETDLNANSVPSKDITETSADVKTETLRTPCPECRKDFARSRDMKRHMKTCHEAHVYTCPKEGCGREYSRVDKLKKHQREHYS